MRATRRSGAAFGALFLLGLAGCQDSAVAPDSGSYGPQMQVLDGSTGGGNGDFFVLPPLAEKNPTITGDFNPFLAPEMVVCIIDVAELGADIAKSCLEEDRDTIAHFPAGSAIVDEVNEQYSISWDTGRPVTKKVNNTDTDYVLAEFLVAGVQVGWVELDPQDPQGPGQSEVDAYAYRVGETIPVKFWLSQTVLCDRSLLDAYVDECVSGSVVDNDGASLFLDGGNQLSTTFGAGSLPEGEEFITVTLERIRPDDFLRIEEQECIPGQAFSALAPTEGAFDAPQFGDCFRVTTYPAVTEANENELIRPAVVSICLDLGSLPIPIQARADQLRMVKYSEEDNDWEALQETAGDCPPSAQETALLDVPDSGFMRYAAMGVNALANVFLPEPVSAGVIKFGGFSSSFSRFRFALPGQMVADQGDGTVIQAGDPLTIDARVLVLDAGGANATYQEVPQPVAGAVVTFASEAGTITVDGEPTSEVTTGEDGYAEVTWTITDTNPGDKTLTATALGLLASPVPDPDGTGYDFVAESITFTATVVGPPGFVTKDPETFEEPLTAGSEQTLSVTVNDNLYGDGTGNAVEGATVTWTCTPACTFETLGGPPPAPYENDDGTISIDVVTDPNGTATVLWTPFTADSEITVTADVGALEATYSASVIPADAVLPTWPTAPPTGTAGLDLALLEVLITDEFDNPRPLDVVTWSTIGPSSEIGPSGPIPTVVESTTDADGKARFTWTLDEKVGVNTLDIAVNGTEFATQLTSEGLAGAPVSLTQSGGGGVYGAGTVLDDLSITVFDQFDNEVPDAVVAWSTGAGSGSITGDGLTNSTGGAAGSWTLPSEKGDYTATASVVGLTDMAHFTASVTCIITVDGDSKTYAGEWDCAGLDQTKVFDANVSGGSTAAELKWHTDAADIYFLVRVQRSDVDKVNSIRIDFDSDGLPGPSADDDIIGFEYGGVLDQADPEAVYDWHLTARCVNRSQSSCGSEDPTEEVVGAVGYTSDDGGWIEYELSHPIQGDRYDIDLSKDTGFFLTLSIGNGAQGNTQVPGFRDYSWIIPAQLQLPGS